MMTVIPHPVLGFFGSFGWAEVMVIVVIGVIVFGKRLPEVGRSVGKSIVEFKKGLAGIEDEMHKSGSDSVNAADTRNAASSEAGRLGSNRVASIDAAERRPEAHVDAPSAAAPRADEATHSS